MCILIVKPKGVLAPSDETLLQCFTSNPDGAGISYNTKDKKIVIRKGLMSFDKFIEEVHKIPVNSTALIHCRISTAGGACPELTHPYPLSGNFKDLIKTNVTIVPKESNGRVYSVGHNGIFYGKNFKLQKEKSNDSQAFIINYLSPLKDVCNVANVNLLDEAFVPTIDKIVDGSRVAIIDNDGNFKIYGNSWTYDNGIYYSNGTYKPFKTTTYYTSSTYNNPRTGYSNYWGDCDYDDLYDKGLEKANFEVAKKDLEPKKTKVDDDINRLFELVEDYPQYEELILNYYYDYGYPVNVLECWIANGYLEYELEERKYEKELEDSLKNKEDK